MLKNHAFTVVELLIVIAVIGILASITIVSYNGIQDRARENAAIAELKSVSNKLETYYSANAGYPANLASVGVANSGGKTFQYTRSGTGINSTYGVTVMIDGLQPHNSNSDDQTPTKGPYDGHSGGTTYCPDDGHVAINGYFCDGSVNSTANLHSAAIKLLSTDSGVPAGAPGGYVGRQTSRDNLGSNIFPVSAGEVYCTSGWAATTSSTVTHSIGLMVMGSSNSWLRGGSALAPTSTWTKLSGCITIPSGFTTARLWTQNDGGNGGTASAAWYQTAITLRKQ